MTGTEDEATEAQSHEEPSATLVPIDDDGGFLVFGELPESLVFEIEPVPYLREQQVRGLADALAPVAGFYNLAAQGWNAYQGAAGLVRLAPETLAAMRAGAAPLGKGGWYLGTLMKGGKFAAQVRWLPVGGPAVAGAVNPALGAAIALLAVQWQLMKISKAVQRNIELTQTVLDELREDAWYELDASTRVVLESVRDAQAIGEVTNLAWDYIQSQATLPTLLKHRQRNLDALDRKLGALDSVAKASEWYQRHFADVLRHSQAVITAQQAISLHHLMRAAHARRSGDERDESLARHVLEQARREHEGVANRIDVSLRALHRSLALWHEADPGKKLSVFGAKDVPLGDLVQAVADLHARAVAGPFRHLGSIGTARSLTAQRAVEVSPRDRPAVEQRLRWVLEEDENALLLCGGTYQFGAGETRHLLVITEHRALIVDSDALRKGRAEIQEIPVSAELSRSLKDGHEFVDLEHEGRRGKLKTRTDYSVVYDALTALKSRSGSALVPAATSATD